MAWLSHYGMFEPDIDYFARLIGETGFCPELNDLQVHCDRKAFPPKNYTSLGRRFRLLQGAYKSRWHTKSCFYRILFQRILR